MIMPYSDTCFLEVSAHVSLKVATDDSFRDKKHWKFRFWACFSWAETEEYDQKNWSFSDKFGMIMPYSDTCFLEVSTHVSLKVATDDSFTVKETIWKCRFLECFSKAKTEECDKNIWNVFDQFGITMHCSATYFLEAGSKCTRFIESSLQRVS